MIRDLEYEKRAKAYRHKWERLFRIYKIEFQAEIKQGSGEFDDYTLHFSGRFTSGQIYTGDQSFHFARNRDALVADIMEFIYHEKKQQDAINFLYSLKINRFQRKLLSNHLAKSIIK